MEITITNLPQPYALRLGIRWRKRDGLLYYSFVNMDSSAPPEKLVEMLRELADKVEKEINT